jgi:DNA (cytosine-5)-methyltransferase 1
MFIQDRYAFNMKNDAFLSQIPRPRTCIDLFAGAGGLSTGLSLSGFNVLFANEKVPTYARSLEANHPSTQVFVDDIREVDVAGVRNKLGLARGELDLVAGGPPCQGFSINAPKRSNDDERNHLFQNFLEFVEEFFPKVVLIENVPGMISFEKGATVRAILESLRRLGYGADVRVLYAPNFGIPQMRWRTIFLATRLPCAPQALFPVPSHLIKGRPNFTTAIDNCRLIFSDGYVNANATLPFTTVESAISDLPPLANGAGADESDYVSEPQNAYQQFLRNGTSILLNHQCAKLGEVNLNRVVHVPPGGSWRDIPHDLLPAGMKRARRSDHTKRYGRLDANGIASTILTKCDPHWGAYFHPKEHRVLSVREAARLQSFPDRARFYGSVTEQYEQVGNAVPPLFARAIGNQIISVLNKVEAGSDLPITFAGMSAESESHYASAASS